MAGCFHPILSCIDTVNRKVYFGFSKADLFCLGSQLSEKLRYKYGLNVVDADRFEDISLPCSRCIGCRLKYSQDWVVRILADVHYYTYEINNGVPPPMGFITLTYDEDNVPKNHLGFNTLRKEDLNGFFDNVKEFYRYRLGTKKAPWYTFYSIGEYGENTERPHYHGIVLGLDFQEYDRALGTPQEKLWTPSKSFQKHYQCKGNYNTCLLSHCWKKGWSTVAPLTLARIAYVPGYNTKVVLATEKNADYYKEKEVLSQFSKMSKSIGLGFFKTFYKFLYSNTFISFDGQRKYGFPRYFDKKLEEVDPDLFARVKQSRKDFINSPEFLVEHLPERLEVKEEIQMQKWLKRIRPYENAPRLQQQCEGSLNLHGTGN